MNNREYEKKLTVMIPTVLRDLLTSKEFKKSLGIPLKEWVAKSLSRAVEEKSFLEDLKKIIPELMINGIEKGFKSSSISETIATIDKTLKPALNLAEKQAIGIQTYEELRKEKLKLKLIYTIATGNKPDDSFNTRVLLEELIATGYIALVNNEYFIADLALDK